MTERKLSLDADDLNMLASTITEWKASGLTNVSEEMLEELHDLVNFCRILIHDLEAADADIQVLEVEAAEEVARHTGEFNIGLLDAAGEKIKGLEAEVERLRKAYNQLRPHLCECLHCEEVQAALEDAS